MGVVMPAEQLRQGDVFSVPGVVVRGPFRVLRATELTSMMRVSICAPDEDTAYPLSPGHLKTARSIMLWREVPVVVHERGRF